MRVFGALARRSVLPPACADHTRTGSHRHDGRSVEPPSAHDHALQNGRAAPRAFVPRRRIVHEKGSADHIPQRLNGLRFTRAAPIDRDVVRAHLDAKIATILSTRSGVGCKRGLGHGLPARLMH